MDYPPIQLKRKVKVQCLDVSAIISRPDSREDLLIVLRFGDEMLKRSSEFSPRTVATKLLPDFPINAGQRLLRRLEDLDLVTRANGSSGETFLPWEDTMYVLTPKGEEAIKENRIFLPERHEIQVRYIEDVLFPQRVIGMQLITESLADVIREDRGDEESPSEQEREKDIFYIPETLKEIQGREITILEGEKPYVGPITFEKIEEKAKYRTIEQQAIITLVYERWREPILTLQVGQQTHLLPAPKVPYRELFRSLLHQEALSWNDEIEAVECQYDELIDEEKRNFKRDFMVKMPQFNELGVFEPTVLRGVAIAPKTKNDAELWADFLVREAVRDYTTENEYARIVDKVRENFHRWENLRIQSIEELIQEEKRTLNRDGVFSSRYWFLQTPQDLQIVLKEEKA